MRRLIFAATAAMSMAAGPSMASPVTINFDDLSFGTIVGSSYASLGVTFDNAEAVSFGSLPGATAPRTIRSASAGTVFGPSDAITAIFDFDVTSVSITGVDVGEAGIILTAFDAVLGGTEISSHSAFGTGDGSGEFYTLTVTGSGIRRVTFSQVVGGSLLDGVIFDNFTFEATTAIPLPAGVLLLGTALGALGLSRRRRA